MRADARNPSVRHRTSTTRPASPGGAPARKPVPARRDPRDRIAWWVAGAAFCAFLGLGGVTVAMLLDTPLPRGEGFGVNLVRATQLGCSPHGFWEESSLQVTVKANGERLFDATAPGRGSPYFAQLHSSGVPDRPVRVTVEAYDISDREPVQCDLTPGPGNVLTVHWQEGVLDVTTEGTGNRSARVELVVGPGPPPVPPQVTATTGATVVLSWPPTPGNLTLARGVSGGEVRNVQGLASTEFDGLCEGQTRTVRLVAASGPWRVAGPETSFKVPDVPPLPPRILSAQPDGAGWVRVGLQVPSHDVKQVQLHAGPAGFTPGPGTLRSTATPSYAQMPVQPGDEAIVARAIDAAGHTSDSLPFPIGGPALREDPAYEWDPCLETDGLRGDLDVARIPMLPVPALLPAALLAGAFLRRRFGRPSLKPKV